MPLQQYLTYQHNVQRYFREHREKYDGIVVPLSIAVSFPSGTYGFVRALCAKDSKKQYAIDPRTALFQKAWNRANVREPHRKMAGVLGEPFSTEALIRPLTASDFEEDEMLQPVVRRCLRFQKKFRTSEDDQRKLNKYKKLLGLKSLSELGDPQFLIPPYFQFDDFDDGWFKVSLRCIEYATKFEKEIPIQPVIHFSNWEGVEDWRSFFKTIRKLGIDAAWLYPNNFREHQASQGELTRYVQTTKVMSNLHVNSKTLFGGYFSILLKYFGLQSFGNGIGYGEWRDSGYHRGGSASTRVYILKLHRFLDAPVAQSLIEQDPEYFGDDTETIASYVASGESLDSMSSAEALDHFMECRKLEIDFVEANEVSAAVAELQETVARLEDFPLERREFGESIDNWATVIETEMEN